jgi:diguanylate cyclase (GGDEF)-like protein
MTASAPERPTVLVVDDEEVVLDLLEQVLAGQGYDVVRARDGRQALEAFRLRPPDLVVTDILMPHMDGYQLCRELKKDPAGRSVPVVFHSAAFTEPEDQDFARNLGAERFLVKPSDPEAVARALGEVLGSASRAEPPAGLDEDAYLRQYNRRLATRLEEKSKQLDEVTRRLRGEVDARREAQERVYRLTYFEPATGLPNRVQLTARLDQAVAEHARAGAACGLVLLDIDDWRGLRCTLGPQPAERLLRQVATRLQRVVAGSEHLLAQPGPAEFAILLHDLLDGSDALTVAHRLVDSFDTVFDLDGLSVDVTASAGVALCPDHTRDGPMLLRQADSALQRAKALRGGVALYSREADPYEPQRVTMAGSLKQAIRGGELVLFYQPKVHLTRGVAVEVEALVRWAHPQLGLLEPACFIDVAERTGQIRGLTRALMDAALAQAVAWQAVGLDLRMSLNLSPRSLLDGDLPVAVAKATAAAGLDGRGLTVEITESALLQEPGRARLVLERLAAQGVRVAIDDFGTGYSSLSHLKHLPVSELKIDKSFVTGMVRDADDGAIVRSTIDLAHNLGLEVTAEGVESPAVWESLLALHCDLAQGYLLGRPMPAPDLVRWMRESPWGRAPA